MTKLTTEEQKYRKLVSCYYEIADKFDKSVRISQKQLSLTNEILKSYSVRKTLKKPDLKEAIGKTNEALELNRLQIKTLDELEILIATLPNCEGEDQDSELEQTYMRIVELYKDFEKSMKKKRAEFMIWLDILIKGD